MINDDIRVIVLGGLLALLVAVGLLWNPAKRQFNIWWPPTEFHTTIQLGGYSCGYRVASDGTWMRAYPENPKCMDDAVAYYAKPCGKKKMK